MPVKHKITIKIGGRRNFQIMRTKYDEEDGWILGKLYSLLCSNRDN